MATFLDGKVYFTINFNPITDPPQVRLNSELNMWKKRFTPPIKQWIETIRQVQSNPVFWNTLVHKQGFYAEVEDML